MSHIDAVNVYSWFLTYGLFYLVLICIAFLLIGFGFYYLNRNK